jgi:hypothetical protein
MSLYTFFFEFRGGTYISQVHADNPLDAQKTWSKKIDYKSIWGMGLKSKEKLIKRMSLSDEKPIPITGIKNTWCSGVLLNGHFGQIHFVKTVE